MVSLVTIRLRLSLKWNKEIVSIDMKLQVNQFKWKYVPDPKEDGKMPGM